MVDELNDCGFMNHRFKKIIDSKDFKNKAYFEVWRCMKCGKEKTFGIRKLKVMNK